MEKHILAKSITHDGEVYKEINFDLEGLKRKDLETAEKITRAKRGRTPVAVIELDKIYQINLATMAADVPPDVFELLGAKDYTQICLKVQDFLLAGESEAEDTEALEQLMEYMQESGRMKNMRKKPTAMNHPA